ncbi:MAG: acyltransferase family protein, partial [Bacilli bacterium]|nr:acyltransferase family protein [Bacilli bacterium]
MKKRIDFIQIIRLFAALFIILYHSGLAGEHGYFAVEIFNIISGFLLIYTTEKQISSKDILLKKIIRIIPLYWFLTICTYILILIMPSISVMSEPKIEYLFKSLFFIPFINSHGYDVPILCVGWTLNYELFFFIIFIIANKINHKHRSTISGIIAVAFVLLFNVLKTNVLFINYYSNPFLLEFILGIISYYVYKCFYNKKKSSILLVFLAIISLSWLIVDFGVEWNINRLFRLGIPAFVLFNSLLLLFDDIKCSDKLLKVCNITFSVYLIEYFTTAFYRVVCNYMHANLLIS